MTALVGRRVKWKFSIGGNCLRTVSHVKPDEAQGQQAAQFGAAFKGLHVPGMEGVGVFHLVLLYGEKPFPVPEWDTWLSKNEHDRSDAIYTVVVTAYAENSRPGDRHGACSDEDLPKSLAAV